MPSNDTGMSGLSQDANASSLSILDVCLGLVSHKRLLLGLPLLSAALVGAISLLLPSWYASTTRILPPQQSQSSALAILGQLGGLAGGTTQLLGLKNPSDTYVAMLRSRTVADRIIERFDLQEVYGEKLLVNTRKELARHSVVSVGRDGVIAVEVEDKDPIRAANMASAFISELATLTGQLAVSEAGHRRLFFEQQLRKAKDDLASAEVELKRYTESAGLINPQSQIGLSVAAAAGLRAQIAAKEIQLAAMRTFATDINPEIKRTLQELGGLRSELGKMEQDTKASKGDVMVPFGIAPGVGLEYIRRYRDVKYFETLFEVLAKQYEIARIDEANDAPVIQVLDAALVPEQRARPKRLLMVGIAMFIGIVVALLVAIATVSVQSMAKNPTDAEKLGRLKRLLTGR